jgi:hypothetical protein
VSEKHGVHAKDMRAEDGFSLENSAVGKGVGGPSHDITNVEGILLNYYMYY